MDLDKIIPKSGEWRISKNMVFVKYLVWVPVFEIENDKFINVFLDFKIARHILKLVKNLKKYDIPHYFISPLYANPKQDLETYHEINIENILKNYSKEAFFDGFKKINYDLIRNLIDYCNDWDCFPQVKDIYEKVNREVQYHYYDFYSKQKIQNIDRDDIRETFSTLYRDIKLQQLLR